MLRRAFGSLGGTGVGLGCAAMVSMLPGAAASVHSVVGITGSSGLAVTLGRVAEPLFIASAILILLSALARSRLVVALSAAGATLLYLQVPARHRQRKQRSLDVDDGHAQASAARAHTATFYTGCLMLVGASALAAWHRPRHSAGRCFTSPSSAQLAADTPRSGGRGARPETS